MWGAGTAAFERCRICRFSNVAVTKSLIFVIDNHGSGAILVAMSADILYSTEARQALRFVFTLTLGIWR